MRWSLAAASLAVLGSSVDAISAGVMEIDLLFPRENETYAPDANMPVVFSIRNAAAYGQYLAPSITAQLINTTAVPDDSIWASIGYWVDPELDGANWTSHEPYLAYSFNKAFRFEASWTLSWRVWLTGCKADDDGVHRGHTGYYVSDWLNITLTTKKGGKTPDLVAATADGRACDSTAVVVAITDKLFNVTEPPPQVATCAVLDLAATPTHAADPCKATIDSAAAASISAALVEYQCNGDNAPASCPPKPSPTYTKHSAAAQGLAVMGAASFTGVLGAVFVGLLWA
ncbi:hypothetical protein C8A05DRAFT_14622 [Staphylotrichum tortipilum]|uniref:DUF7136 domain-containing protein n=1 Tax=Staphylotrichum tortipilum TaxID=2831512 RepID=A0AAN6MN18_9PEZI|nr:hypothetical protein C8A05DRAFT_14622 [Staphylotrichum longicolle]